MCNGNRIQASSGNRPTRSIPCYLINEPTPHGCIVTEDPEFNLPQQVVFFDVPGHVMEFRSDTQALSARNARHNMDVNNAKVTEHDDSHIDEIDLDIYLDNAIEHDSLITGLNTQLLEYLYGFKNKWGCVRVPLGTRQVINQLESSLGRNLTIFPEIHSRDSYLEISL